ncbi:Polysaccharide biosynthesis protein [Legionella busanensis]|uniref:Polysaccharide biosynthesis protein n=1 Tax=Legionella busanensis TaxID=190655 RepID=A0A378JP06_9GAMM|nr:oligosaccharide flippase family protein [Legionella busanensis]STX52817.1 Polysaccharide biosynthesis protein [Legionella busanensis]
MDFALNLIIIIADQLMLFIINMLVARHAGEALFGDYAVATSSLFLIATLITLGIDSIIAYYVPKYYVQSKYSTIVRLTEDVSHFLKPLYLWVMVLGCIGAVTLIALATALKNITLFDIGHPLYLFLWGTVALSLYTISMQYFRAINYMRTAILLSLLQTIFYFILSLIIYFYLYPALLHDNKHYFPHIMLIGFILSYLLILVIVSFLYKRSNIHSFKPELANTSIEWKEKMYGYTIQNLNRYVFTVIPLIVIEWLSNEEGSVGLFAAVTSIIAIAAIAIAPIGILIGPDISASFAQSREALKKVIQKYLLICVGIALIVMLIIGLFAKQILLLYQSHFMNALPYTYACLINILTYSITMPLSKMIQYSHRGSEIGAKLTLSLLLFQFVACIIFISWLDLLGAIICYIGINIIYIIAMVILGLKIYKNDPFGSAKV